MPQLAVVMGWNIATDGDGVGGVETEKGLLLVLCYVVWEAHTTGKKEWRTSWQQNGLNNRIPPISPVDLQRPRQRFSSNTVAVVSGLLKPWAAGVGTEGTLTGAGPPRHHSGRENLAAHNSALRAIHFSPLSSLGMNMTCARGDTNRIRHCALLIRGSMAQHSGDAVIPLCSLVYRPSSSTLPSTEYEFVTERVGS
ncbi:hypothetical protein VTN96DRAFT_9720 [Rasamsonia emersonii]